MKPEFIAKLRKVFLTAPTQGNFATALFLPEFGANAEFIATACNTFSTLLDEVERLRAERDALARELEAARRVIGFAKSFDRCWGEFADEIIDGKCLCDACNEYVGLLSDAIRAYDAACGKERT